MTLLIATMLIVGFELNLAWLALACLVYALEFAYRARLIRESRRLCDEGRALVVKYANDKDDSFKLN